MDTDMPDTKKYILDQSTAEKKLRRMALEIIENNFNEQSLILAGIRENGSVVAKKIQAFIAQDSQLQTEVIRIDIDKQDPRKIAISKEIDFSDKAIIIIDDVADSGKTLLYALKPFLAFLPKKIQTLVLVERSHNTYPVQCDYIGLSIATTLQEHIFVEVDAENVLGAYLV